MIQHWKRGILTPNGRVAVVKSLVIAKISHSVILLQHLKGRQFYLSLKTYMNLFEMLRVTK